MVNRLVITFVKNATPGKTKTRLAASIGDDKALEIYQYLLELTENSISNSVAYPDSDRCLWRRRSLSFRKY